MAVYGYIETQTLQPAGTAILNDISPCRKGYVIHRPGSGILNLRGIVNNPCGRFARYNVRVSGNMAVTTGGTVGEIQVALAISGEIVPITIAAATPAAVEQFWNFSCSYNVDAPICDSVNVSVKNATVGDTPIDIRNLQVEVNRIA